MLTLLRIRSLAIVHELEIELGPELTVITGETGAGKSILIAALQLVLGARARQEVVRSGADQAVVEALFEVGPTLASRLAALDLPPDDQLVIRRTVHRSGRSRATVNGSLVTLSQLRALAEGLVDISSQHEHHSLANPSAHLAYLDAYANHGDQVAAVAEAYDRAIQTLAELHALEQKVRDRSDREDLLRFQLAEIERLSPDPDTDPLLDDEAERLRHAEVLAQSTAAAAHALYEQDDSLCERIGRVSATVADAADRDSQLQVLVRQLDAAREELEDAATELGRYSRSVVNDPARLQEVEDRLHALRRLTRKYACTIEDLANRRESLAADLAVFDDVERVVGEIEARLEAARSAAWAEAEVLSTSRRSAAAELGQGITRELADLGMGDAEVRVRVRPLDGGRDALARADNRLSRSGMDHVELLIAPNPGEEPKPLRKIASGGELSRSLLAIKRALAGLGDIGLYVFDEVDTGVGGAIAEAIGRKIASVATRHQVLCITHQPQIAAWGTRHLHVSKSVDDGRTFSSVAELTTEQRVEELARMLGGARISDTTRQAARELLAESRQP
ncbi:MAG: DNA repair protein RecN (Recombination protein N) [Myxococcota bacterium]|jgi:DNA repair protein RecN (Recombination protein N)